MSHWLDKYIREQEKVYGGKVDMNEMAEAQEDMEQNYESEEEYLRPTNPAAQTRQGLQDLS